MKLVKNYNKEFKIEHFKYNNDLLIIAGPCSVEDEEELSLITKRLLENNIYYLRAAIFKPRTSPYTFQGIGFEGFKIIKNLKEKYPIKIVSELVDLKYLDLYLEHIDIIQVGARNMQNFELLKALGKTSKPILLKRGFGNTVEELLYAAEYIMENGNDKIILCERGIKTFEDSTRNTLDISSIGVIKALTKLPIIVDPSHASGRRDLIESLSLASVAAGADGLMLEVHPDPDKSVSDAEQTISLEMLEDILKKVRNIHNCIKR